MQASSTDSVHNSARNKAVGGGWEKDGDDWNKSSVKTTTSGFSKAGEDKASRYNTTFSITPQLFALEKFGTIKYDWMHGDFFTFALIF